MESQNAIVLYDIPGGTPGYRAWSPSTWKVRFALNYKGIPLRTEWVEYPDIKALYHRLGIEPTSRNWQDKPLCTLPVIHDPSTNKTISDSSAILDYLEATYPNAPTLLPKGTLAFHRVFKALYGPIHNAIWALVVYPVYTRLNERSQGFFRETREEEEGGKKLEDICGEEEWKAAKEALGKLDLCLSANGKGHDELVMGDTICFADVQVASSLMWAKASLGEDSEGWKRICSWHGGKWKRVMERFDQYAVVDG